MTEKKQIEVKPVETIKTTTTPTEANKIWNEIKNKPINMFAIQNQTVQNYCQPVSLDPSKCFLKYTASSVIPALETVLQDTYDFEASGQYIIVSRKK